MHFMPGTRLRFLLGAAAWCACLGLGMRATLNYSFSPAPVAAPLRWPTSSTIALDPRRPTLLLFLHPYCPCSLASVRELERAVGADPNRPAIHVVFHRVDDGDLTETELWRTAEQIPGARLLVAGDDEVRRFGAQTSGEAMVFSPDGGLLFHGGLTVSRGHAGENPGTRAIANIAASGAAGCERTPVFGCRLF